VAAGTRIPGVPRSNGCAALHYAADSGWQIDVAGRFMDAVPANDFSIVQTPACAVLGLGAGYKVRFGA
jgi:iron complex outermembrane receptor protein